MNEDSSRKTLKSEWSLLVESFIDDSELDVKKKKLKLKGLSLDFVVDQIKDLSALKKSLYQKIEKIKEQIESSQIILENLELVGSDTTEIILQIDQLHVEGEKLSADLLRLDQKLKKMRSLEDQF